MSQWRILYINIDGLPPPGLDSALGAQSNYSGYEQLTALVTELKKQLAGPVVQSPLPQSLADFSRSPRSPDFWTDKDLDPNTRHTLLSHYHEAYLDLVESKCSSATPLTIAVILSTFDQANGPDLVFSYAPSQRNSSDLAQLWHSHSVQAMPTVTISKNRPFRARRFLVQHINGIQGGEGSFETIQIHCNRSASIWNDPGRLSDGLSHSFFAATSWFTPVLPS